MKKEIIVDEHGDLMWFKSSANACEYLEPIDVTNQEYIIYAADGELMQANIEVEAKKKLIFNFKQENIRINGTGRYFDKELVEKIRSFLINIGVESVLVNDKELLELVEILKTKQLELK